jgi:hypothetical protein
MQVPFVGRNFHVNSHFNPLLFCFRSTARLRPEPHPLQKFSKFLLIQVVEFLGRSGNRNKTACITENEQAKKKQIFITRLGIELIAGSCLLVREASSVGSY